MYPWLEFPITNSQFFYSQPEKGIFMFMRAPCSTIWLHKPLPAHTRFLITECRLYELSMMENVEKEKEAYIKWRDRKE